jgi:hypothetical protein
MTKAPLQPEGSFPKGTNPTALPSGTQSGRRTIHERYKIDNNDAENGIRPLAVSRKNCLFCGNHEAAKRTAIIYSLPGTCKINNLNPAE